jgi:hypothetical protein
VNVHANILFLFHNGAPFGKCDPNNHNLPQSGRLFILRVMAMFRQLCVKVFYSAINPGLPLLLNEDEFKPASVPLPAEIPLLPK